MTDTRKAFEAWAKSNFLNTDQKIKDAWGQDRYFPHIESMWLGWQAAIAAPQPEGDAAQQERDMATAYALFSNLKLHGEYAALQVAFGSLWPAAFSHGFQTAKVIYKPESQPVANESLTVDAWENVTKDLHGNTIAAQPKGLFVDMIAEHGLEFGEDMPEPQPVKQAPKVVLELPDGDNRPVKVWWTEVRDGEIHCAITVGQTADVIEGATQ